MASYPARKASAAPKKQNRLVWFAVPVLVILAAAVLYSRRDRAPEKAPPAPVARLAPVDPLAGDPVQQDEAWNAAVKLAAEAEGHVKEAASFKAAGKEEEYGMALKAARIKFQQALKTTVALAQKLVAERPSDDKGVSEVSRIRSHWADQLSSLNESSPR
jgi:hypothetical protein